MKNKVIGIVLLLSVASLLNGGCGHNKKEMGYISILQDMANKNTIAVLSDEMDGGMISSYDRTGGNDDFGTFLKNGPKGWKIIADLKGPGYISRFWCTGSRDGTKRFRFYFDGSRTPQWDVSLDKWMGERGDTGNLPLMGYEPFCWFSYLPIPYKKRLIIMEEEAQDGEKLYYQVNYVSLPDKETIESFRPDYLVEYAQQLDELKAVWQGRELPGVAEVVVTNASMVLNAGTKAELITVKGPAVMQSLVMRLDDAAVPSAVARQQLLRELIVEISWDGCSFSSIEVPFGDFFGSMWGENAYQTAYFGLKDQQYYCRFPMPFAEGMRIALKNESKYAFGIECEAGIEELAAWTEEYGYFHAFWNKSTARQQGQPHTILNVEGKGKYVGCLLGVRSFEKSWWVLEGDEVMYIDGESSPSWHGTGLEDYFNGGWYYGNALASPFHGVPYKAPFNIYQYRIHQTDPVRFDTSFRMYFERGPNHASPADMESTAFYYMTKPQASSSVLGSTQFRYPSTTPLEQHAIMHVLHNHEVMNDWDGAVETIVAFIEKYPEFPFKQQLLSRKRKYLEGENVAQEGKGLLGVYCNMPVYVYLDGKQVAQVNDDKRMFFFDVLLSEGEHVLAVRAQQRPYPDWVQVALKTRWGIIGTDGTWKYEFNPTGRWTELNYDDSGWVVRRGVNGKGPPIDPYVWLEPNEEAGMQIAWGICPVTDWPEGNRNYVVYRKRFVLPPE